MIRTLILSLTFAVPAAQADMSARLVQRDHQPQRAGQGGGRVGGLTARAPQNWPQADMGGGAFYGVGMTQRAFHGSMNYWHFGALCFPGRMEAGSYAVSWMQDWSVVVAYDKCVDWDAMVALDGALAAAVFR